MQKPKIAVIGAKGFPAWGGAARTNEAIFNRLKNEYEVTLYAMSSHAKDKNYQGIKQIIFSVHRSKKFSTILYYLKSLIHTLIKGNYNLVHVNHHSAAFLVPLLKLRFPVVLNLHGLYNNDSVWNTFEKNICRIIHRLCFRFADIIITVQKGSVKLIEQYNPGKVVFIPNGVEDFRNIYSLDSSKIYDITFSAARIIYLKGLHLLLLALSELQFEGNINIIGDLSQQSEYKSEIIKLSKNLNCNFTGLVKNKKELFEMISQSRVFVFPSYSEGMSNMLLEVVSLKIPVIASDIPQNSEIFTEKEMLFFKSEDKDDLKDKIYWSFNNYNELQKKAENAYEKIKTVHNWDHIALKYDAVYKMLIHR